MVNGVIIQKKENLLYRGVEGDNWFLNDDEDKSFNDIFEKLIEKAWYNENFVDTCNDLGYIAKYIKRAEELKIPYRILLCETNKPYPIFKDRIPSKYLGFDYAYGGGSYYSAVLNDLIMREMDIFSHIKTNKYGLLDTEEDINRFMLIREKAIAKGIYDFEKGDFVTYKLYEIQKSRLLYELK